MEAELDSNDIQAKVLLNTLVEVASRTQEDTDNINQPCCVICLDSITQVCEARPCSHRNFDYLCLLSWLEQQTKCPLCKSNVDEVRYDFGGDNLDEKGTVYRVPRPNEQSQERRRPRPQPYRLLNATPRPTRRWHEDVPPQRATADDALLRRRYVYQNQLYSLHVGSNQRSGYRDLSPQIFERDPEMASRARAWLRRELQVFEFLRTPPSIQSSDDAMTRRRANNAEFLLEYIIAILKTVDVQGSQGQAQDMLKDFLGRDNTKLLLHELKNFLRSPWSLEVWDRKVQYSSVRRRPVGESHDGRGHRRSPARRRRLPNPDRQIWRTGDSYLPTHSSPRQREVNDALQYSPC